MKNIKSLTKLALASSLFLSLASCSSPAGPSDEQIKTWVEKNPEVIMKSLMEFQRKQQEESQPKAADVEKNAAELFQRAESPSAGAKDGKIKIAYFYDFLCGHCEVQSKTNAAVLSKRSDVQIIYKNLPILSEFSLQIAQGALAAHLQGKYKEFYDAFYKTDRAQRKPEVLKTIAQKIGLKVPQWEADMKGPVVQAEIDHVRALATKLKINGTPAIAIAPNAIYPGRVDQLASIIEKM